MTNSAKEKEFKHDGIRQVISCFVVFLPLMSGGMAAGWTSPTEKYLTEKAPSVITIEDFSWINSFLYFGGMTGCLIWNPITEKCGRKFAGYLVGLFLTASWGGILCSTNFVILLICRFGLGISFIGGVVVGMSYSNEITSERLRGKLCSLGSFFINMGFLIVYLVGCNCSYNVLNVTCFSMPVLFLILFFRLPESPVYLMMDNQEIKAVKSLMWFRGNKVHKVGKEMAAMQSSPSSHIRITIKDVLSSKKITYSVFTAMMLFTGQQFSGITILTSYTVQIFDKSGSKFPAETSTVIMGILQAVGCVIPGILVNRVNQKNMLALTFVLAALSLMTLGGSFMLSDYGYCLAILNALPLIAMICYILSFTAGIAPIPFILFTRMFEPNIMSLALCFGQLAGNVSAFFSAKIFPTLIENFNYSGTFYILAATNLMMAVYVMKGVQDYPQLPHKELPPDVLIPADQNMELQKSKADLIIN